MEEKLNPPEGQSAEAEVNLFQRCQELQARLQERDDLIGRLEQQLEEQVNMENRDTWML